MELMIGGCGCPHGNKMKTIGTIRAAAEGCLSTTDVCKILKARDSVNVKITTQCEACGQQIQIQQSAYCGRRVAPKLKAATTCYALRQLNKRMLDTEKSKEGKPGACKHV
jgi:hypothetical protein